MVKGSAAMFRYVSSLKSVELSKGKKEIGMSSRRSTESYNQLPTFDRLPRPLTPWTKCLLPQRHFGWPRELLFLLPVPIVFPVQEAAPLSTSAATSRGSAEMSVGFAGHFLFVDALADSGEFVP
jgi:hypothetical protein